MQMILRRLTPKGKDTLTILIQLTPLGFKCYFNMVFEDKVSRRLIEIFPQLEASK